MAETCPNRDRLRAVLAGTLSAAESEGIGRHVEGCETCQKTLEELARSSWDDKARQVKPDQVPLDSALQEVMQQALSQATLAETQAEQRGGRADGLDFLAASDKPGHLGRLGHYDILEVIGKGGFGTVFKAFDEKLHRVVAIKVLAPELAANASARKRFSREARAAAAIKDDHVIAIYAVEDDHQPPYLAMEYVDGISLQDRLDQEGALDLKEILRIAVQTACGLAAAHKQGLVHRDIKPANILLENGVQRVKITDFGLARAVDDASISQSGVIAGTPMYMAPEQAAGETIDHRADLFSLGSVLYVMCTGRPPFRASGTMAVMKRVMEDTPRESAAGRTVGPEKRFSWRPVPLAAWIAFALLLGVYGSALLELQHQLLPRTAQGLGTLLTVVAGVYLLAYGSTAWLRRKWRASRVLKRSKTPDVTRSWRIALFLGLLQLFTTLFVLAWVEAPWERLQGLFYTRPANCRLLVEVNDPLVTVIVDGKLGQITSVALTRKKKISDQAMRTLVEGSKKSKTLHFILKGLSAANKLNIAGYRLEQVTIVLTIPPRTTIVLTPIERTE